MKDALTPWRKASKEHKVFCCWPEEQGPGAARPLVKAGLTVSLIHEQALMESWRCVPQPQADSRDKNHL